MEYKSEIAAQNQDVRPLTHDEMHLQALAPLLRRTLLVMAHPDDESISCGGLLQHIDDACVVFATDGAPEDEYFWRSYGSRSSYAAVREQEARAAMEAVGVQSIEFLPHRSERPLIDQHLYRELPSAFAALADIVEERRPDCLLTLAYEGGHPDHDSVSFLSAQLGRTFNLPVWETPLYHRHANGNGIYQSFVAEQGEVIAFSVCGEELAAKMRMLGCYKSQFDALPSFKPEMERFRPQTAYDYSRRPHAGKLNYEIWQWRMTPEEVCSAFVEFFAVVSPAER